MSYISERIHHLNLLHSTSAKLPLCKWPAEQRKIGEELTTNVQGFWWFKHRQLNATMICVMNGRISLLQLWFQTAGINLKKLQAPHKLKKLARLTSERVESLRLSGGVASPSLPRRHLWTTWRALNALQSKHTLVQRSSDTGYWLLKI